MLGERDQESTSDVRRSSGHRASRPFNHDVGRPVVPGVGIMDIRQRSCRAQASQYSNASNGQVR